MKKIINLLFSALLLLPINASKAIEGFSLIPAGPFTMGDSLDGLSDAPTRTVTLDAFYMGKYEVTKAEWDEVRTWGLSNGYTDLAAGSGKASNHPVHTISWYDMVKWCNARSQKEGLTPVYYTNGAQTIIYKTGSVNVNNEQVKWTANGYRLPTEAEWEKAARGGLNGKRFPWGDTISHSQANYRASSSYGYDSSGSVNNYHPSYITGSEPYTSPVGALDANGYGLHDISGNVWELCWDWYGSYTAGNQTNPRGVSSGIHRVARSGGWDNDAYYSRIAYRNKSLPTDKTNQIGFRVLRESALALIPAGIFTMGNSVSADINITDAPTRTVTLDAFYIGKYEVTKAEWDEVTLWAKKNGYRDLAEHAGWLNNDPRDWISWYDVVKWCNARSEMEGLTPVYYIDESHTKIYKNGDVKLTKSHVRWAANGYRLPTEAEWEKAARGGLMGKRFPWGDTISHSQANYISSSLYAYDLSGSVNGYHPSYPRAASPVGDFAENGYGLWDIAGNVSEWCWDWHGDYAAASKSNPRGATTGTRRVCRGGSWNDSAETCRTANRYEFEPEKRREGTGLRVVRSTDEAEAEAIIHVATTGNDQIGTGQANAPFATIQKGISHAQDGDTVLVAAGTYTGEGNRNIDLLGKAVTVKSVAGPKSVTLDLQQNRAFLATFGESFNTVIDGFSIINGDASTSPDEGASGVGIISISADAALVLKNCIFSNNKAENKANVMYYTAMASIIEDNSNSGSVIENCLFYSNICRGGFRSNTSYYDHTWINTSYANVIYGRFTKVKYVTVSNNSLESLIYAIYSSGNIYWSSEGLAISIWEGNGNINSSIITGNGNSDFHCAYSSAEPAYNITDGTIIEPASGMTYSSGYSQLNPLFASSQTGDFSLSPGSPAIDAGDPSVVDPDGTRSDIGFNLPKAALRYEPSEQSILDFASISPIAYSENGNFMINAPAASSNLPVYLTIKSGPARILNFFNNNNTSNGWIFIEGTGTVVLAANQYGNANYLRASEVTTSFTVAKGTQTIGAFSPILAKTFGNAPFEIDMPISSISHLPVSVSVRSGPATISGNTVTITGAGTVVLAANQAGDANYLPATEVTTSFTVGKGAQNIAAFSPIATKTFGNAAFEVTPPTSSSNLPVTLSVKSGPATILNNIVTLTGAGTVVLAANQAGDANYLPATEVTTRFAVGKALQTISAFSPIVAKAFGSAPFSVASPTSSSKLSVTLSVKSGPATISGNTVTLTGVGTVVLVANQAGNANYLSAAEVTTSFTVGKGAQNIAAFSPIATKTFGNAAFEVTPPTSSSNLPVTLSVESGPATISGNIVTLTGAGTVVLAANQSGDAYYDAAEVTTSFVVSKAAQKITFPPIGNRLHGNEIIALSASTSSKLPINYSVISGPAKIDGSSLSLTGAGSVTIRASQPGNENYSPATTSRTFNVTPNTSGPTLISLSRSWFYYDSQVNSIVAYLSAADPDQGDKVAYGLVSGAGSGDNGKFTIVDGVLRTATTFDFKTQRSASIRVRATDSLGQYKDQIFNLILVDPNPWAAFELKAPPFTEAPSYVNVVFQLRDKERRRINLPQELLDQSGDWFVVSEDGKPITPKESILQVARNEVPLKVRTVLLLDNSNSVGADLKTIKSAAKTFVDRMFQTQEIAIYSFSGGSPNLVKNFTAKSAAGQKALKSAIDGIKLGSPSTNLYGSVLAMLQLPKWKESFTLAGIETGCLVVMTDGSDTAGLATLGEAVQKRDLDKKQIFAVGLGQDIEPAALNSLQNGDDAYTPVLNPTQLAAAFTKIQSIIEDGAKNFYWLNYASPKRGNINRNLTIALKNNINTGSNRMISTKFNSNGFYDISPGVVINRSVNVASGVTSLKVPANSKISVNAFTMLGYRGDPVYTWKVNNSALASVTPSDAKGSQANIVSKGLDGTTKLTLRDKVNGFSKTIDLIIGTGVAPVSKSANVVQSAQLSAPATQESVAMMDISSLSEATPSLAGSSPKVSDTLKSKESFSLIPAGPFTMGDSLDGISDAPRRTVALDAYYIGKYEVTKAEWDEVRTWALFNGYADLAAGSGKASNHPVQSISWYDMVKWCNARSQKEGLTPVYYINNAQTTVYKTGSVDVTNAQVKWSANGYRLPTEAEWEKAARGGLSGKRFAWGNTISHSRANYYATSDYKYDLTGNSYHHPSYKTGSEPYTSPVGAFAANGYGLYDMAGNVFEWCWDWHVKYSSGSQTNPRGATSGTRRVFRGGSWDSGADDGRVALRDHEPPGNTDDEFGFRVARSLPAGPPQITSDLSKVIITKGKSTAPYAVLTNFLAKNFSASNLPHGLRLQSNGVISGTPTKSGTYNVTIVAKKIQDGKVVKSAKATKIFEVK